VSVLASIPVIGGSCPTSALALGGVGIGPVCQLAAGAAGAAGDAAGKVAEAGASSVLGALGSWVSDGATWLLTQIGKVIGDTTGIDLGASWFTAHYQTMAVLTGVIIVPLLLLGIMQSIYRQNASMLVRSVVLNVPLAVLLTAVAVKLVQLGLAVTDAMSAAVARGTGLDTGYVYVSMDGSLINSTPVLLLASTGDTIVATCSATIDLYQLNGDVAPQGLHTFGLMFSSSNGSTVDFTNASILVEPASTRAGPPKARGVGRYSVHRRRAANVARTDSQLLECASTDCRAARQCA
jgi:hypothetical protein